jgi:hypothetical protein
MIRIYVFLIALLMTVGCYHHRSHHHHHHKHRPVINVPKPDAPKYGTRYRVIVNEKGQKELQRIDDKVIGE